MSEFLDYEGLQRYDELIKTATVNTVTNAINALDGGTIGTPGAGKTITALSQTNGNISATFGNISITKSQVSDFPTIPTVNNAKFSVKGAGTEVASTTANASTASSVDIVAGNNVTVTADATNNKITIASTDTNTTYTFAGGTNKFTVTPSGGTAQNITITPSISNNVTASGNFAANAIVVGNAANKVAKNSGVTISTTAPSGDSADTTVPTSKAVWSAIANGIAANDAMVYKGTVAGGSTGNYGALTPAASKGETYKVTTAGKIDGVAVEIGDMLICNTDSTAAATSSNYSTIAANWDFIQVNIDGAVTGPASSTSGNLASFDGTTGKVIKDSSLTTTNVSDAVTKKHSHSTLTLSTTAQAYDGTHTLALPSSDPYTSARTPASHTHGNITNVGALQTTDITIASGDKLVVTDASNSNKVARTSVSFDGSTTTKALTQKGTFETFATTNTDRYVNSASFADDTTANANNPVKMTLTRAGSDTATVTGNLPKVSSSSAGVVPKGASVSSQSQSTKFLREDGSWAAPSYTTNTNTTYKLNINGTEQGGGTTSLGTVYAPTTAGTSGQILTSSGSGAPTWSTASKPNYEYGEINYSSNSANASGTVTVNGSIPLHILTATSNISSISFTTGVPIDRHSCHIVIIAASNYTVTLAHDSTVTISNTTYTFKCPEAEDVSLDIKAGGFVELDLLRIGTNIYVRGI